MSDPKTLVIEIEERGWLKPDGGFSADKAEAALFVFRTSPTGLDERRVAQAKIRIAGEIDNDPDSHGAWLNRELASKKAQDEAYSILEDAIGGFVPGTEEGPEQYLKRKNNALQAAWETCKDPAFVVAKARFESIWAEMSEINLWARWEVMQVSVPAGWRRIHEHPAYVKFQPVFWQAWRALHEEQTQGKTLPSGS